MNNQLVIVQMEVKKLSPVKVDDLTPIAKRIFRQNRQVSVNDLFRKARHRIPGTIAGYHFALKEMVRRGEFRSASRRLPKGC